MPPSTALLFLGLCSTWLIQRVFPTRRGIRSWCKLACWGYWLIVFILALRYFTGLDLILEKLLYPGAPVVRSISSGRMSPCPALGFFLAIPALFLDRRQATHTHKKVTSAALSLALLIFSSLICLGIYTGRHYLWGTTHPHGVTSAIHSCSSVWDC